MRRLTLDRAVRDDLMQKIHDRFAFARAEET
jgi:hypothetical protein